MKVDLLATRLSKILLCIVPYRAFPYDATLCLNIANLYSILSVTKTCFLNPLIY